MKIEISMEKQNKKATKGIKINNDINILRRQSEKTHRVKYNNLR